MRTFFDKNKTSNLEVLKSQLLHAINEANKDSAHMQDFVQLVGLIMTRTRERALTDHQISYVTSRLLDSPEKTMLGTGEGKAAANMLLFASQALLGKDLNNHVTNRTVIQRDLEDFQQFFENLGLKTELKEAPEGAILAVTPAKTTLRDQVQLAGRSGRNP